MKTLIRQETLQDLTVTLTEEAELPLHLAERVAELCVDEVLPYSRDADRVKESIVAMLKATYSYGN